MSLTRRTLLISGGAVGLSALALAGATPGSAGPLKAGGLSVGEIRAGCRRVSWCVGDAVCDHVGIVAETSASDPVILHSPSSDTTVKLQPLSELMSGGRKVVGIRRCL